MPKHTSIGPVLRARRQELGLTQAKVAKALGVPATYVVKLEREDSNPSWSTLSRWLKALDMEVRPKAPKTRPDAERAARDCQKPGCRKHPHFRSYAMTTAEVATTTLNRLAALWESHKPAVQHEARTLAGALALMKKHNCKHPQEAIEQEAKRRAIAQFKQENGI